jgi:FdhD protein
MSRVTVARTVQRYADGKFVSAQDAVAGEEPLELRVAGRQLTLTMRTPGNDVELAHGYLFAEGVIAAASDVRTIRYCDGVDQAGRNTYNVLDVTLAADHTPGLDARLSAATRSGVTTSACGVCGSASIDALRARTRYPLLPGHPVLDPAVVARLPALLRQGQRVFRRTGGLHAAALVDPAGELGPVREDVGRHNAVDKVIGAALLAGELPGTDRVLLTSSRASFELVQKAVVAGIPVLVAVSAPSSLAVELAADAGMTLIGFARDGAFNLYTGGERVVQA